MPKASTKVTDIFGSSVFSESVMRERLPRDVYDALRTTIAEGSELDRSIADVVANAMKDWALEKGATHFCHWFQPMTGITAEKHDSFISPTRDGRTIMEFSGKELIQGEPDASSFPSGGLRATFEARGYTAWDCTSPVFVKADGENTTLFIPCAFCSYTGQVLDKKTPLLRSMEALSKQAVRVLRAFGNTTTRRALASLGAEQEYFLVDATFCEKRLDLLVSGRTLFGAPPPKGQELDDHYFGQLHERVATFMSELNHELWRLGVTAKTQHNEVAPGQYEIAPVYGTVNVATDHNHLVMEALRKIARRHDFVALLHEKPFAGVNGSGKHNNWGMDTDDGINLFDPGSTPHENAQFLTFLCAVIRGVDKYAPLLRASVATAGNDHRLGANEAPPAIISIFLGERLNDIFEQLAAGGANTSKSGGQLKLGVSTLPPLPRDCTDRNRTSPFAFTGKKFEFRMPGSALSTAGPMFVLNTIVAETLGEIADELEHADNVPAKAQEILQRIAREHKRVVFNGNNYSAEWVQEAARRGLPNLRHSLEALEIITAPENTALFEKHGVLTSSELHARQEILLEAYSQTVNIEALAMVNIGNRQLLPASIAFSGRVAAACNAIAAAGANPVPQERLLGDLCEKIAGLQNGLKDLATAQAAAAEMDDVLAAAKAYREQVIPVMERVRASGDALEQIVDAKLWPLPTYADMLFSR